MGQWNQNSQFLQECEGCVSAAIVIIKNTLLSNKFLKIMEKIDNKKCWNIVT